MEADLIGALAALAQVVLIDVTLAGDNAVVLGLAVSGLPAALRGRAILAGVGGAALLRILLSLVAVRLLAVLGLTLAGGLLLLWVAWKMFRELSHAPRRAGAEPAPKTWRAAVLQILLADLSMSLDNVLAVAGAARAHVWVMVAGLALSVVLTGIAASLLARVLHRYRWLSWAGLAVVVVVALRMIVDGGFQVAPAITRLHL